jgi:hypothetical protein
VVVPDFGDEPDPAESEDFDPEESDEPAPPPSDEAAVLLSFFSELPDLSELSDLSDFSAPPDFFDEARLSVL